MINTKKISKPTPFIKGDSLIAKLASQILELSKYIQRRRTQKYARATAYQLHRNWKEDPNDKLREAILANRATVLIRDVEQMWLSRQPKLWEKMREKYPNTLIGQKIEGFTPALLVSYKERAFVERFSPLEVLTQSDREKALKFMKTSPWKWPTTNAVYVKQVPPHLRRGHPPAVGQQGVGVGGEDNTSRATAEELVGATKSRSPPASPQYSDSSASSS